MTSDVPVPVPVPGASTLTRPAPDLEERAGCDAGARALESEGPGRVTGKAT